MQLQGSTYRGLMFAVVCPKRITLVSLSEVLDKFTIYNTYYISQLDNQIQVVVRVNKFTWLCVQGRRRRSGWSGLSRTNNLELNQLADQLELNYSRAIFG